MANLSFGGAGSSYYDLARQGQVFTSMSPITAPTIYTSTVIKGPLIWNGGNQNVNAVILGITCGVTTASGAAGCLGIAIGPTQAAAPTSTTAVGSVGNTKAGARGPTCSVYAAGTVSTASATFLPLLEIGTGAITVVDALETFVPVDGLIVIPPTFWCAVQGSATLTTLVAQVGIVWAEIPVGN